jgi:hypothetical protein
MLLDCQKFSLTSLAVCELTLVLDLVEKDEVRDAISVQWRPNATLSIAAVWTSLIFAKWKILED